MKRAISLILVLVLCFSIAGCSEEEQTQIELYQKYAEVITALENKEYNYAIHQIGNMIIAEQKQNDAPRPAVTEVLFSHTWYARVTEDNTPPMEMRFLGDGTCIIDGKSFTWLEMGSNENNLDIVVLDNGAHKYIVSLNAKNRSQPRMALFTSGMNEYGYYGDKHIANYFTHPMISTAMVYWRQAGKTDELPDSFSLNEYSCHFLDASFVWEVAVNTDDSLLTLNVFNTEGTTAKTYTIRIQDRNGIYVLILAENGTDLEATYYCEDYGKDDNWIESIYGQARKYLDSYLRNSNNSIFVNDTSLTANQSRAYIYDLFSKSAGYRDSDAYLARFSSIPSQLVKLTETTVDQLDKSNTSTKGEYIYNPNGTLSKAKGVDIIEAYGITYSDYQNFFYDETGKLTKIIASYNIESPNAIGIPEYDDAGRLVSMAVQTSSAAYTSTFTYDDQGRIATADINPGVYDSRQITYTYDDTGKLIQKVTLRQDGYYTYTQDYTYEGSALTAIHESYSRTKGKEYYTTDYTITNDSQGRPLSIVITTTNPNNSYKSVTQNYHYEDLYFFDTTGLLEKTN